MALSKINTNQIVDGAVATADIADGLITTAKLADGAVTTAKITDGNISTAKLADDAVTTAKVNPAQTDITSVGTLTALNVSGDIELDGGDFVFNNSGASKDFRIEGDTFSNLFICDGSEDDIGMGLTPTFTSGNGVHLADDFKIGFGAGGNSRPDFQLGYTSSTDRLSLACGFGADDADVQITTGGKIGLGSVGGGAISHNIQIKDNAPEIMMEETGSGGSKRISMGVTSSGTPFINAEQSGGIIDVNLSGDHIARFHNDGIIGQNSDSNSGAQLTAKALGTSNTASQSLILEHETNHFDGTSSYIIARFSSFNRFLVFSNGSTFNASNTYGNISDERLKTDIVDAKSQWDDLKNLKVRNFKKYDTGDLVQLGVVAQEVEKVSPSLIQEVAPSVADVEHNSDFGSIYKDGDDIPEGKKIGDVNEKEKVKAIKYSVLYMKAIKALQEAMERIETLEDKVEALEKS
tara:strand:- start:21464 stop:22855 length:1392 start_codon:yes stop_codon:yes gene_type:complete